MANIYKNEKKSLTNTDLTTLYTVPGNSRAIVKSVFVKLVFSFLYIFAINLILTK